MCKAMLANLFMLLTDAVSGWDVLLEAFTEEFTGLERVCLAIRSTGLQDELNSLHNPNHARIIKLSRIPAQGTVLVQCSFS